MFPWVKKDNFYCRRKKKKGEKSHLALLGDQEIEAEENKVNQQGKGVRGHCSCPIAATQPQTLGCHMSPAVVSGPRG